MGDARCTPGHHLGEDLEGRRSVYGDRLDRPSLLLTLLMLVAVVLIVVPAVWTFLSRWVE
jgi:hypothetical protein